MEAALALLVRDNQRSTFIHHLCLLASREGGRDADFVAVGHGRIDAVEEADVFAIYMDEDEAAHLACFVKEALFYAGESGFEIGEDFRDGAPSGADLGEVAGEFAERCWYEDRWHF